MLSPITVLSGYKGSLTSGKSNVKVQWMCWIAACKSKNLHKWPFTVVKRAGNSRVGISKLTALERLKQTEVHNGNSVDGLIALFLVRISGELFLKHAEG